jgi:hypothetical protein
MISQNIEGFFAKLPMEKPDHGTLAYLLLGKDNTCWVNKLQLGN